MLHSNKGFVSHTSAVITSRDILKIMQIALNHPDNHQWRQAMKKEYEKLESKDIFKLVWWSDVPQSVWIYSEKWVFDSKENYEPTDERAYKVRWVILSNLINKNILQFDYCTYTLIVVMTVIWLLFALAAANRWCIYQLDVAVAFLNGIMQDTIYMRQPTGFEKEEDLVCKLKKSLYDLIPAARIWYNTLTIYL